MKITDKINVDRDNLRKPEKVKDKVGEKKSGEVTAESKSDRVSLSGAAKGLKKLNEIVDSMPDVRDDKVDTLKSSIASGSYNVKGSDVAGKLLTSSIIDGLITKK
jgi:negative regulator of flagellin synthesis FlgM